MLACTDYPAAARRPRAHRTQTFVQGAQAQSLEKMMPARCSILFDMTVVVIASSWSSRGIAT